MTQDEIIEIARQVSNTPLDATSTPDLFGVYQIVKFAKLIAAEQIKECVKACAEDSVQAMDFSGGAFVGGYFSNKLIERFKDAQ
jgi:hypothetical protein